MWCARPMFHRARDGGVRERAERQGKGKESKVYDKKEERDEDRRRTRVLNFPSFVRFAFRSPLSSKQTQHNKVANDENEKFCAKVKNPEKFEAEVFNKVNTTWLRRWHRRINRTTRIQEGRFCSKNSRVVMEMWWAGVWGLVGIFTSRSAII